MQAVIFKSTDPLDWRTMQAIKKSIKEYSQKDPKTYGDTVKRESKDLRNYMSKFFPGNDDE